MISKNRKITIISVFVLSGLLYVYSLKFLGIVEVEEGGKERKFFHPYMQTVCVYIGYVICGIGYWRSPERKNKERENKSPLWKFIIPATSGVLGSVFISMGYNFLSPSTVLLFRSGNLLAVMVFSKLLMSLKIQRHQWVGSSISIVGLFFVGFADFYFDEQSTENNEAIGYIVVALSTICYGFVDSYEQKMYREHQVTVPEMIWKEGMAGLIESLILSLILAFIPCSFGESCVFDANGNPFMQLPIVFLSEVFTSWVLLLLVVALIFASFSYSYYGSSITKYLDALTRNLVTIGKISLAWLIGILITIASSSPNLKLESLDWRQILFKVFGFTISAIGTLIYTQIILKKTFTPPAEQKFFKMNEQTAIN